MIRCGLIGYGAWGWQHARVIAASPDARLVAIAALSESTRARAHADHPSSQIHTDYRALLASSDLDAVAVVLPSHLHYEVGRAVLESGRHLLMEKPLCLTVHECHELTTLARRRTCARGRP